MIECTDENPCLMCKELLEEDEHEPYAGLDLDDLYKRSKENMIPLRETASGEQPAGICAEAFDAIYGPRQDSYGPPYDEFNYIATIWSAILSKRNGRPVEVQDVDVATCMIALKIMRETHKHERDNLVDVCGYAESVQRIINHKEQQA